jgi:glycosyltransferase involved in cell wall biosynthesis
VDCSVVITTYNRAKLLADTLLSLADQQVSPAVRWEVIVVDNNSRDETEDVVRRCSETTSLRIRHVFEPRQGQSFARNRGIEAAEGAVILFTDDDIIPNPDWVSAMLRAIDADDCEGAGGKVLPLWEGEVPSWLSGRSDLLSWLALVDSDEACMLDYPLVASRRIVGASMGFRRSVFQEFGRFPTNLGHRGRRMYGGEEVELINRILLKGRRIRYDPSIVVRHRIGPDRLTRFFFLRRHFDHGCGQAQFLVREDGATFLGVDVRRSKEFLAAARAAAVHSVLGRPDALSLQLRLAVEAGLVWGSLRWPSGTGGGTWA